VRAWILDSVAVIELYHKLKLDTKSQFLPAYA